VAAEQDAIFTVHEEQAAAKAYHADWRLIKVGDAESQCWMVIGWSLPPRSAKIARKIATFRIVYVKRAQRKHIVENG
jgi:hypothetical protein